MTQQVDDAAGDVGTVAPAIVRELAPWYGKRHAKTDARQAKALDAIEAAFSAYQPVLDAWKAEKKAARAAAKIDEDDDFDFAATPALRAAALAMLDAIAAAAKTAGITATIDRTACRLAFVSGDNLLVRFTQAVLGSLKTTVVFSPLELAERGSNGTFIHSPRTLLLSELGVKTLRPQTTELHESRHAYHFALHRERDMPTILDARLVPAYGKKRFTTRKSGYKKGFSVDELVTFSLQTVQDRGGLSLALRDGTKTLSAVQKRAFVDAAARAKKHSETRHGPSLAAQLSAEARTYEDALALGAVTLGAKGTLAIAADLEIALEPQTGADAHLRVRLGNKTLSTALRLHVRDAATRRAFEDASAQGDLATLRTLVASVVAPWVTEMHRFAAEVTAIYARIAKAAAALAAAAAGGDDPTTVAAARTLERELSKLATTIRSRSLRR
ncbi:MAG: hypothetical protein IT381_26230 [Deltaproteobacteria bacterium]|nr:hypothetical protein [Deltaproteobacteria bacterium]